MSTVSSTTNWQWLYFCIIRDRLGGRRKQCCRRWWKMEWSLIRSRMWSGKKTRALALSWLLRRYLSQSNQVNSTSSSLSWLAKLESVPLSIWASLPLKTTVLSISLQNHFITTSTKRVNSQDGMPHITNQNRNRRLLWVPSSLIVSP